MNAPALAPAQAAFAPAAAVTPEDAKNMLLLGLIGSGIGQSLTPSMQMEEGQRHGLRVHYQLIDLDRFGGSTADLPMLLQAAKAFGFAGLNITYPCKQAVIPLLDELSDEAQAMGAVNTVVIREGRLIGHNTDGSGWARGFTRALPNADLRQVALLGAGGAGAAIAHAVLRLGAHRLKVTDADPVRAQALCQELNQRYGERAVACTQAAGALQGATGLIHATPTGMAKLPGLPLDASLLRSDLWVSEVVYFPLETELLKTARALGCGISDGGGMAVGQALGAFELFTGRAADAARVERHFRSLIAQRAAQGG